MFESWYVRLMDEKASLDLKLADLEAFNASEAFKLRSRYEQSLFRNQAFCMRWYSNILAERIELSAPAAGGEQ